MKKTVSALVALLLSAFVLASCSLPPVNPITRQELMRTRIYNQYVIQESPEELLYALNTRGEVIVEGKRNITGKEYPVYLKLLAMPEGVQLIVYER